MPPASTVSRKFWAVMVRAVLMGGTGNPPHLQRTAATSARHPDFDSLRKGAEWTQFSWLACAETIYKRP